MRKKAQSFNEYAVVIALITLVGIGMQAYIKRGIQAVIKGTADVLTAGGTQPAAPVPATPPLNPMGDLAGGSYYGITFQRYWHPAFIKEYIEGEWGYLGATLRKNADRTYYKNSNRNYEVSFLPAACIIEMIKDGNDVYYKLHTSDSESPVTIARENATTHDLTLFYTSDPAHRPPNATYNYLGNSALPYNDAFAQQKGIEEPGLYRFNQTTTVTSNKNIRVKQHALKATNISRYRADGKDNWHPAFVTGYLSRFNNQKPPGFIIVERKGNDVYYYHYPDSSDLTNKVIIGGEDAITRDFTSFGPEGYPDVVFDDKNDPYNIGFIRTKNAAGEVVSVTDTAGNSYKKYQIVRISTTPVPAASALPVLPVESSGTREKTINNDTTVISGSGKATYKLGTDIYKPKPRPPK